MTYEESLNYIYSVRKVQKSSSHERIEGLLEYLGQPHKKLKYIHVAGTNGKGSVSGALNEILISCGLRVGLFTSPFVVEFGERIQVNSEYISHEDICLGVQRLKEYTDRASEDMMPTVFELTTALAFDYFARKECDIVVLEAGIGGEHDSTNVIPAPLACVFTSVSLDHTEMLGDTTEKIAKEKSGIIKEGSLVVSYPLERGEGEFIPQDRSAAQVFKRVSAEKGCGFFTPDINQLKILSDTVEGSEFVYKKLKLKTQLCGAHQIANMITVAECALQLREKGLGIRDSDIVSGIEGFFIPGRMEKLCRSPLVILDGGHNEGCMRALRAMAEKYLSERKINVLMASMKDKDYMKSLEIIAPLCENMIFTQTDTLRGETPERLRDCASGLCGEAFAVGDVKEAFNLACEKTGDGDCLIVCGSFYLVSDIRNMS